MIEPLYSVEPEVGKTGDLAIFGAILKIRLSADGR